MTALLHFFSIVTLTGFFVGIYRFSDKSLTQSTTLKDSLVLGQSSKLKNGNSLQVKYRMSYLFELNQQKQKVINLKTGNKIETKLIAHF